MERDVFPTVAVLMGGPSNEHPISLKTGEAVASALAGAGCTVHRIVFSKAELPKIPRDCDVVFPALHGFFGEDGQIQRLLENHHLPYVGCDVQTSQLIMDKAAFKASISQIGANSPRGTVVTTVDSPVPDGLELPVIVKPNREGSTIGLTLVEEWGQLPAAIEKALTCDTSVLIETFIRGIECTVPVLNGKALPIVEIIPPSTLFDNDAKYAQTQGSTIYNCPPKNIPLPKQQEASQLAEDIFRTVSARDMLRIDMILNEADHRFYVLEGNSLPGFTATSLMPKSAAAAGISFNDLCLRLVRAAYMRGANHES